MLVLSVQCVDKCNAVFKNTKIADINVYLIIVFFLFF